MSRPCTECPITRVSVTNDGATDVVDAGVVVVVVVLAEVEGVVVVLVVGEVAAGSAVVSAIVGNEVVVDCVCDVEEQATNCQMTSGATHHDLVLIRSRDQLG